MTIRDPTHVVVKSNFTRLTYIMSHGKGIERTKYWRTHVASLSILSFQQAARLVAFVFVYSLASMLC